MSFRHLSAVKTLNGRAGLCFRKCRFSVTRASAPTHSAYAAMKASAGLNPLASYFAPNSKGIRKSSSIMVISETNSKNSRNTSGAELRLTSVTMVRGIRSVYSKGEVASRLITALHDGFWVVAKAYMYMFVSRMSRKFLFPDIFPCFTKLFDNFLFAHTFKRRSALRCKLINFIKMFFSAFGIRFFGIHFSSPHAKDYYAAKDMSRR